MIVEGKTEGWLILPIETLPAWALFNNVQFDGIEIGPLPGHEDRGSTVLAKRQLHAAQLQPLMTVPRDLILSLERVQDHAKADADFRAILDALGDFGRTPRGAILSFLLTQAYTACPLITTKRGLSTPFTEYVKYLPSELLPTFWTEAERQLLVGTTLAPALSAKLNSLYREFEQLRLATKDIAWCRQDWWNEVDGVLSFDDWLQVDAMYRSRALEFPGVGDCMVPCIDMANHAGGSATAARYEIDDQGNALFLLRDDKVVDADSEITITYGDEKGACEMIFSYGFVEESMNSARELFLNLNIPDGDPLARPKASLTKCAPGFKLTDHDGNIGWDGEYVWLICTNAEDGLNFKVQQTIAGDQELVATWKDSPISDFDDLKSILQKDPLWDVFQLRAAVILQDRIASQLTALYGSEDDIAQVAHGKGTDIRQRPWQLALKLRELEGELLEQAYSYFEDMKVELAQRETVVAYLSAATQPAGHAEDDADDFS